MAHYDLSLHKSAGIKVSYLLPYVPTYLSIYHFYFYQRRGASALVLERYNMEMEQMQSKDNALLCGELGAWPSGADYDK